MISYQRSAGPVLNTTNDTKDYSVINITISTWEPHNIRFSISNEQKHRFSIEYDIWQIHGLYWRNLQLWVRFRWYYELSWKID